MINFLTKIWKAITSMRDAKGNLGKKWWRSKTLGVNFIAAIGAAGVHFLGVEMDPEAAVGLLAGVNYILRLITREPVGFIDK